MILVTGGAGFIGSNLVRALCAEDGAEVAVADDLSDGGKFRNLLDSPPAEYFDKDELLALVTGDRLPFVPECVFHLGACTDTTETDGRYMMANNYGYSKALLAYCLHRRVPFVYASSAAVYGAGASFRERREDERPLNVYGFSKLLFDEHVRRLLSRAESRIVGLRYFNVYGPRESHKGPMASVILQFDRQLREHGRVRLFRGTGGYADGEQRRDFIHVEDAVAVTRWLGLHARTSGIFNVGTGRAASFNEVARAVIAWHGRGGIEYFDPPPALVAAYQSFTEADLTSLRAAGYPGTFRDVTVGVREYLDWLHAQGA